MKCDISLAVVIPCTSFMLRPHPLTLGIESSHTSSNLLARSRAYNKISEQHLLAVVRNSSTAQSDVMGFILQHRHHTPYKNRKKHYYYIYFWLGVLEFT